MNVPYGLIAGELLQGRAVPFLGAAASYAGVPREEPHRLPDGAELAQGLIEAWEGYPGERTDPLTKVTQYYAECLGNRMDIFRRFRALFFEEQQALPPAPTARLLAEITPRDDQPFVVITTNYDCQVEKALDQAGRPYAVVIQDTTRSSPNNLLVRDSEKAGFVPLAGRELVLSDYRGRTVLYKLHGGFGDGLADGCDTLVVTEADYVRFLARLCGKSVPPPSIATHILQERRMLFLGYSMADWNLRVILYQLKERNPKDREVPRSWGVRMNVSELERQFWDKRDVALFDMDLAEFVTRLRAALATAGATR